MEGWPEGRVVPSAYRLPVVPRNPLPNIQVSPEQQQIWSADGYSVGELRYTPDGKTLVVLMSKGVQGKRLYQIRLWDTASGKERGKCFQIDPEPQGHIFAFSFLTLSPDSKHLAVKYNLTRIAKEGKEVRHEETSQIHLFDLQTGQQVWHNEVEGWSTFGAGFSPDSQTLVSSHSTFNTTGKGLQQIREFTGEIHFWDVRSGKKKGILPGGPYQVLSRVEYSPDGKFFVFHEEQPGKQAGQYLGIWDLSANKLLLKIPADNSDAVFSPGGDQLAILASSWTGKGSTCHRTAKVWDLQSLKEKASLTLPTGEGWLSRLTWSVDSKFMFFSSDQGQLWRWDPTNTVPLATGESIIPDPSAKQPPRDARFRDFHLGSALYAFGVNGKLPQRTTRKNLEDDFAELPPPEIVIWDLKTMQRRGTLTGHHGMVSHLAFSPDGKTLVSGGSDGTVRFWSMAGFQGK